MSVFFCQITLTVVNFWQMNNAARLSLFGIQFQNLWTFWFAYTLFSLPFIFIAQYGFYWFYWYGYHVMFPARAWYVQATSWGTSICVTLLMVWLYFGELPTKNAVIALLFLAGALIAIIAR